ncbi:shikimate dehydrogenase [Leptolyngbya sp. 7M]|uniref:shikimate dehydrogenase n=1 Tax=Leptolyngbya sp. 7M TaxID=2812896 RepID=UPI001B8AB3B8|nr:shikimate dehydrogenase [Leptolyngbya sp. 7M]QYO66851.1 shikimate dehydrogenase [Leptolyngbya sp. 7M]
MRTRKRLGGGVPILLFEEGGTAPGQIMAGELDEVYRVNDLDTETEVFGIIAGDTSYSMSPYIQNAAFRESKMNRVFVPFQVLDIGGFIRRMVSPVTREIDLNFRGFAVTNPHKRSLIDYLDAIDETAEKIGAVNTIKLSDNKVVGFNTDADGFIKPLLKIVPDLGGTRVTVIGAGGAARACLYALKNVGADVELLARDPRKAKALAEEFEVESAILSDEPSELETDIIVNATPLGTRGELENQMPIRAELLSGISIVYDLIYNPRETQLLREARAAGCRTIDGLEMLLAQGAKQFEIWTGTIPDKASMRNAALKILAK